jgi:hypothetical protein
MQKLSHSARETFETCGYKYELHYNQRLRSKNTSSALLFGSAFDEALNVLLLERNLAKAKDVFLTEWLKNEHNFNIVYYKSDLMIEIIDPDLLWDLSAITDKNQHAHYLHFFSMEVKGIKMLEAYDREIMPRIKRVISVQEPISVQFPQVEGVVRGIRDLKAEVYLTEDLDDTKTVIAIIDNKSASAPYPKNSVKTKEQTAFYVVDQESKYAGFAIINKKDFSTQFLIDEVPAELAKSTLEKFQKAFIKIAAKDFKKNKKGCFSFGQPCPFKSHCFGPGFGEDIYEKVDE